MNVSLFPLTNSTFTNVTSRTLRNPLNVNPAALKNEKAARDFEAMLLTPVLDSLQETFGGNSEAPKIPGASDYRQMATEALGQAIAARGGIGIAQMILRHLQAPEVSGGS
jgi:Rod binding domain-containing protein